ncbi:glycerate kinase [uncultured Friedmanniella sp.]|uniref:glycerate kinase n=1 Tax=uncultured Friedmanniella sp. TaxID=335381 RepID=UPI0035CB0D26
MTVAASEVRVLVSPDKFKGSLTAVEAAEAIATGLRRGRPGVQVVTLPVADGGEGTVDAVVAAGYEARTVRVTGPTGQPVEAVFALSGTTAVVELAEASGLRRLPDGVPAPLTATTYGTGELARAALDAGARRIVLGIGGSATTDGGAGLAQALGVHFLDAAGAELAPGGAALADLHHVDVSGLDPRLSGVEVVLASDVDNPLVGPEGAAAVYGPQKGATASDVALLDAALRHYADCLQRDLGVAVAAVPGAGAAGGAGAGALAFLGARAEPGIALVLRTVGFADALVGSDLVVTGEGSLDAQSLAGKAPVGVASAARAAGVPVVALVGRLAVDAESLAAVGIGATHAILDLEPDLAVAQRDAAPLLARLAEAVGRTLGV